MIQRKLGLPIVMAVAVALRLMWIPLGSGTARFTNVDSTSYLAFAAALPNVLGSPSVEVLEPSLQRSPGYPIFVWLTGAANGSTIFLLVAQCVIGGVVVVGLTYLLAERMAGPKVAIVASVLVALDPASIGHSLLVGTETLFTAVLLAAVLLVGRVHERSASGRPIAVVLLSLGATLGVASLVRPQVVYLVPFAALGAAALVLATRRDRAHVRSAATAAGLVLVGAVIVGGPWLVRNSVVADRWLVSTAQGQNLADFGAACMEAEQSGVAWWPESQAGSWARHDRARLQFEHRYGRAVDIDDVIRRDAAWSSAGRNAISAHPRGCAMVMASSLVRVFVGPADTMVVGLLGAGEPAAARMAIRFAAVGILAAQLSLASLGLLALLRHRRWAVVLPLALPIVLYLVSSAGPQLYARFRVPIVPYLAVLAGIGAVALLDRSRSRPEAQPEPGAAAASERYPATSSGPGVQLDVESSTPSA